MKSGLFVLPFLALLVGAVGTAVGSSLPQLGWATYAGWAVALAIVGTWFALDQKSFVKMLGRKGAKYGASSGLNILLGLLVIAGVAMLSTRERFNKSFDVTEGGLNTLSDQSIKIIEKINKDKLTVKLVGFFQDNQIKDEFKNLVDLYVMAGAKFSVEYVDPEADPTRAIQEKITSGNTVILRLGEQEARVSTFNEEKFTNGLIKVLKNTVKTVYFTSGHGEGPIEGKEPTGYDIVVQALLNNRYEVKTLSLLEEAKVPDNADLLIIAGPKYDFKEEELRMVESYLKSGGALSVMVDALSETPRLFDLLTKFGIEVQNDWLILDPQDPRAVLLGQNNAIVTDFDRVSPVTKDFASGSQVALLLPFARSIEALEENVFKMKPELVGKTSEVTIRISDVQTQDDLKNIDGKNKEAGVYPILATSVGKLTETDIAQNGSETKGDMGQGNVVESSKRDTRIVVVGSSHFARNQGIQMAAEHRDLFVNMANFLLQDEDFISIRPKEKNTGGLALTSESSQLTFLMLSFIYPFAFLGTGVVYWLKRRRA